MLAVSGQTNSPLGDKTVIAPPSQVVDITSTGGGGGGVHGCGGCSQVVHPPGPGLVGVGPGVVVGGGTDELPTEIQNGSPTSTRSFAYIAPIWEPAF